MSLIFAVDSDRKQSAALASLLRSHVNADLVQSGSAKEGLNILQGRIPDLILTSSLLSPRDEAALANHLRELGDGAAHVHTLTIPVIAMPQASRKKPQGVLGGLRREKENKPSGCDPEVFAREVALYLDRAVERRVSVAPAAALAEPAAPEAHGAVIESQPSASPEPATVTPEPVETEAETFTASGEGELAGAALPLDQLLRLVVRDDEDRGVPHVAPAPAPAPVEPLVAEPEPASAATDGFADAAETAGLSSRELAEISAPRRQGRAPDAVAAPEPPAPVVDMGTCEDLDLLESRFAAVPLEAARPAIETPSSAPVEDVIAPSWPWFDDQAGAPLADVLLNACGPIDEVAVQPEPEPEPEPEPAPTLDLEALEFIGAAAHRAGLHALETLAQPAPQADSPEEPADEAEIAPVMRRTRERIVKPERKRKQKTARPAQDEWGMYDPAQAGPAALLDDDEWEEEPETRQTARSRATVY